jgi:two-component system cell cycle sensor histidine kinase/response regulator CckA
MTRPIDDDRAERRRAFSIRHKLAALMAGMILLVMGLFGVAAYREVRGSAFAAANQRLVGVRGYLREYLAASAKTAREQTSAIAADTAMQSFLRRPNAASRSHARFVLNRIQAEASVLILGIELWSPSGSRLLTTNDTLPAIPAVETVPLIELMSESDSSATGWIRSTNGAPTYPVLARVGEGGAVLGYVVQRRVLNSSPQGARQLSELIGSDARALLGNLSWDLWTDFGAFTAAPPDIARAAAHVVAYSRGDTADVLAVVAPVADTPWAFAVEFPRARVFAQAHAMLWKLGVIALLLMLGTGAVAWALSVGLNRPISALASAAKAISAGDYSSWRVQSSRRDELGELAAAFNTMADSIKEAHHENANKLVALEASEVRYRDLFESNPHAMWVYDFETQVFLAVNDAAVSRYGFSREEFLQMTIMGIRPVEELPRLARDLANSAPSENGAVWRHQAKDGTVMEVEVSSRPLLFDGRNARLVHAHDLTQRRRAEESLRAAQERLQRVIASSGAVIYELRLNDDHIRLDWISENLTRILGYSPEEARSLTWWSSNVHPDDRARFPGRPTRRAYHDGSAEYRFRHKDGHYRWLREQQRVLRDADGQAMTVVVAWLDITEWRQLAEQFQQSQKMEAIGQLAGGVAHDFNNLLTVILAEADLALLVAPATDTAQRESLDQIRKSAERAAQLTRQLLTFSRRQVVEPTAVNLNEVITGVDKMIRRLIGENVRVALKLEPAVNHTVADRGQIEQVFVNLVVNARDAMPDGGTLTIETENVRLDEAYAGSHAGVTPGDYVMIAVSDTGSGMSDDVKAHLFEPFFTTKELGKGTGLGLATCYAIARQFGGHIGVYSEVGIGTTMRVYLPEIPSSASVAETTARIISSGGNETILLVEDEPQVRRVASRMLKALGYVVHEAPDAEQAIALLESFDDRVDLMLTDVVLPGMGGRALAECVERMRPGTPVLFASGYSDDMVLQHFLLDGEVTLLQKPFTSESLADKVREALNREGRAA